MAEAGDLDPDLRRRILVTMRELDRLDHYALLGVARTADKKSIKRAYYDRAAAFHPDRYFRKNLGSFGPKMEIIFSRLTVAHDTLTTKDTRAEYDAYLEEQRRSRGIEELLEEALAEAKRAEASIEKEIRTSAGPSGSPSGPPVPPAPQRSQRAPLPNVDVATRRDALARRLLGGRGPSAKRPSGAPQQPTSAQAVDALRRRYDERVAHAKVVEARKYAARAEEALLAGDTVAAANAFRIACGLAPKDAALQRRAEEAQGKADAVLGDTYARQAEYEEKTGQLVEAARSWVRVCKARPGDAGSHERAAQLLLKIDGDKHEASRLAKRACELDPKSPRAHATLGSVYLAAGLMLNARREIETAAQLDPQDVTIQAMLSRLEKLG